MTQPATEERVDDLEERSDNIESALGQLIVNINAYIKRSEREMREFKDEMRGFKTNLEADWCRRDEEMKAFREEMKAERGAMNKKWGELSNKMGTLVEDIVAPNLPRIFKEYFGATSLKSFAIRYKRENQKDPSKTREFDAIGVSEKYFFVNETKSSAKPEYCKEFVDILPEIPDYFPECAGRILVPIFSTTHLPEDCLTYLTRRGVYAMEMKDDTMDLVNFDAVNSRR